MKLSNNYFYTIREKVKNEESNSGNLLVRSGMIKKTSNGIYMYLPLGLKVLENIEKIVREEMNKAGAQELLMPSLLPEDVFIASGRREKFGEGMFSLKDRYDRNYVLGPTHEELFAQAAKEKIKSYKDMPFNLYQIGRKYRDEPRPRFGLIRIREFLMKDAYSFDTSLEGLDNSYKLMFDAYKRIFDRMNINYKIVNADTGAMGGILSEEFQALAPIGEDTLVICSNCDYASNIEVSECISKSIKNNEVLIDKELIHTPNAGTIEEVTNHLGLPSNKFVKTLIYKTNNKFYACMVAGDRDINELKLSKLLGVNTIELATPEEVEKITKAKVGFAGPIDLNIPIIVDNGIINMTNYIVGANQTDYHYQNVNNNDFEIYLKGDIKNTIIGDPCPKCGNKLTFEKGIEIGNTFKLGSKYSESLDLYYLNSNNSLMPVIMGSYGIGIERIMASIVEQNNDGKGIIWPIIVAPYKVALVIVNTKDDKQLQTALNIYEELQKQNIDCILDDRDERVGVKFNDMDLIGIPIRITIGNKISEGLVELKYRDKDDFIEISINEIIEKIKNVIK